MSNAEARKQLANSSALLQKKYEALKPLLANSALAKEYCLAQSFLHGENWGRKCRSQRTRAVQQNHDRARLPMAKAFRIGGV